MAAFHQRGEKLPALELFAFNRIIEHIPEDMTVTVEAGMTLAALQSNLATRGQWLPVDPPHPERLTIESLLTPGHTAGMLNFVVNGTDVFTGDTLFKGSVGGVRAPGSTSFADLRHSIMDVLMKLPHETRVHPGHTDPTTIGDEWESNAFVRLWRGLDEEGSERCSVEGQEATLVLWAPDYDGGHKAWVRWPDGSDDIVPGSRVERG